MKKYLFFLLAVVLTMCVGAAEKNTTILVKQLQENQGNLLPDCTIELKAQNLKLNSKCDKAFADGLLNLLQEFANKDLDHYVYCVTVSPKENNEIEVSATGLSWLEESVMITDNFFGVYHIDRAYILFTKDKQNESLLKSLFSKDKGKHSFIQEFELVEDPFNYPPSALTATWKDNKSFEVIYMLLDDSFSTEEPAVAPVEELAQ